MILKTDFDIGFHVNFTHAHSQLMHGQYYKNQKIRTKEVWLI